MTHSACNNLLPVSLIHCVIAMCELGVESVDTLFLALPEMQDDDNLEVLKSFWEVSVQN